MFVKYDIDFQDGLEGWISVRLVYSGCRRALEGRACDGCHNEWLWEFKPGACRRKFRDWLVERREYGWTPSGIVITGGEPLDQDPEEVAFDINLVKEIFNPGIPRMPVLIYTGYEWSDSLKEHPIVRLAEYLKVGPYRKEIPPGRYASGNQRLIRLVSLK